MGIVQFTEIINFRFKSIVEKNIRRKINSLSIDYNSFFYNAAGKTYLTGSQYTEEERIEKCKKGKLKLEDEFLDRLVIDTRDAMDKFPAGNLLLIAIDGIANAGKMSQQKTRRFKGAKEYKNKGIEKYLLPGSFTPGTPIMIKSDKSLRKLFKNYNNMPKKFVYSSHLVEGEAEHKIMKYLRDDFVQNEDDGVNIIYGGDSDLFILAVLSKVKNLYLYKDNFDTYYNIDKAREIIKNLMKFEGCNKELLIPDFSVLVFFAGNDFLPQFPNIASSLGSFEIVFEIYGRLKVHLSKENGEINFTNYLKLLKEVNNYSYNLYAHFTFNLAYPYPEIRKHIDLKNHLGKIVDENYNPSKHRIHFRMDEFKKVWYEKEFKPRTKELKELYPVDKLSGDHIFYTQEDIGDMCYKFLQTVQWNHYYYTKGLDKVSKYHFYPYKYTPLTEDLEIWMRDNLQKIGTIPSTVKENITESFNPIEQMMMVLPPISALEMLPKEWRETYKKTKSVNPIDFEVLDPEGTMKDFHIIVMIPPIDILLTKYLFEEKGLELPKNLNGDKELVLFNKDKKEEFSWKISDKILM